MSIIVILIVMFVIIKEASHMHITVEFGKMSVLQAYVNSYGILVLSAVLHILAAMIMLMLTPTVVMPLAMTVATIGALLIHITAEFGRMSAHQVHVRS